jgi:hypothetical protein
MGTVMSNIVPLQPYPVHPLRSLKQFSGKADSIVWRYDVLDNLPGDVRQKMEVMRNGEEIDKLFADAKRAATLDKHDKTLLAWCEAALERFDPADNYEIDNGEHHLKPSVIAARIAVLVGGFPGGSPSDPAVFLKVMMEHVCSVEALSLVALDAAIWEAVGTLKFIPSASELMVIVKRQKAQWNKRFVAIQNIAESAHWTLAEIGELETEWKEAAKARAVKEAQRDLDRAHALRGQAISEAVKAQHQAATAAQAVADALDKLAQCEAFVTEKAQALAVAVKCADSNGEVRS